MPTVRMRRTRYLAREPAIGVCAKRRILLM
jgi:hypothetical protein